MLANFLNTLARHSSYYVAILFKLYLHVYRAVYTCLLPPDCLNEEEIFIPTPDVLGSLLDSFNLASRLTLFRAHPLCAHLDLNAATLRNSGFGNLVVSHH